MVVHLAEKLLVFKSFTMSTFSFVGLPTSKQNCKQPLQRMAVRLPWSAETLHVVINHTLTNGMVLKQHMLAM